MLREVTKVFVSIGTDRDPVEVGYVIRYSCGNCFDARYCPSLHSSDYPTLGVFNSVGEGVRAVLRKYSDLGPYPELGIDIND